MAASGLQEPGDGKLETNLTIKVGELTICTCQCYHSGEISCSGSQKLDCTRIKTLQRYLHHHSS